MLQWFRSVVRSNPCCVVDECINGASVGFTAWMKIAAEEDCCLFDGEIAVNLFASVGEVGAICLELSEFIVEEINNSDIARCITVKFDFPSSVCGRQGEELSESIVREINSRHRCITVKFVFPFICGKATKTPSSVGSRAQ